MRQSFLFWGIILLAFGGIFILDGFDLLHGNPIEYLWQLFLIILGTWILIRSLLRSGYDKTEHSSISLQGATRAIIRINHGAGQLNINSGAKKGDLLTYSSMGTIQQNVKLTSDILEVRISHDSNIIPLVGFADGLNWDLELSDEIPLSIFLETGASQILANLNDLNLTYFNLSTGASSSSLTLPSIPEHAKVSINAGAASLNIQIPVNVAAQIRVKDSLTSLIIDKDRFIRVDANIYQSQDYNQSKHRTEIKIEAGVGSIVIN